MRCSGLYHSDGDSDHDHQHQLEDLFSLHGLRTWEYPYQRYNMLTIHTELCNRPKHIFSFS